MTLSEQESYRVATERDRIRDRYLAPRERRPASAARGIHHTALISGDVTRTVEFYQDVLGFPLIEMFENRDLAGSTHFFFDVGHGNALAFFDLPGVDPGEYAEVLGGLHHLAISVSRENWEAARARLDAAGVPYQEESGSSIYLRDPDGARIELIADPLGEMYGHPVG
jgi:catechol 2,3-dioxygenase-like lactoylglutathione lyase family enzyme